MPKKNTQEFYYQNIKIQNEDGLLSLEQVAMITGTKRRLLEVLVKNELLEARKTENEKIKVHIEAIETLKKMLRLHYDLGVGWTSMPIVLDLLDKIDALEKQIQALQK